ncbi:MAG TPA: response regulator [Anaerolineae bacterium]|nr:response regulator [Anaerolineae bacterium]HMR67566.1 response regulator [Anaerolineae bacterium]
MLILYVEDNFENKLFVRRVVESMGHEMLEAETGLDSLALAQDRKPDLVLMDVNIPGMDGLETTAKFRENSFLADIPIIALTANAMKGDKERCLAAGCNGYMQKPVGVSDLRREIDHYAKLLHAVS